MTVATPDIFLVRARPWDTATTRVVAGAPSAFASISWAGGTGFVAGGSARNIYLSDSGFTSAPSDTIPSVFWDPRLKSTYNFESSLFRGEEPEGRSDAGRGEILIINTDADLDDAVNLGWDGRAIEAWTGKKGMAFSTFTRRFNGTAESVTWNENEIVIRVRDRRHNTERSIAVNLYAGTGGLEGTSDVANFPKPQVYGEKYNVRPILVDAANLVYQVHDRLMSDIFAVRDKGVALTQRGNVATTAISATVVSAGTYVTAFSSGLFKLGASPDGLITADVKGDAVGGYVSTTAAIARRIVTTRLTGQNLADPGDLDTASIDTLISTQSATVGVIASPGAKAADVLDALLIGIGAFWYFTRDGKFALGRLENPADLTSTRTITEGEISAVNRLTRVGAIPSWRRRVAWKALGVTQSPDALAGGVSDADVVFYGQPARFAEAVDNPTTTKHKLAQDKITTSFFATEAGAQAEATRVLALHKVERDFYEVGIVDALFEFSLAQIITLTLSRFDLTTGKNFIVIGISEIHDINETVLTLWG